ncbi:MAG TPA: PASTA domain-containing protein [Clostridia bacterium]|nr:PASTA domain-containing protein [Clostridia bacterium]
MPSSTGLDLRRRALLLFSVTSVCLFGLLIRLGYIQFVLGAELSEKALDARMQEVPVEARRGVIYDRKGRELAISATVDSVFAIPAQIKPKDLDRVALALSEVLGIPKDRLLVNLTKPVSFVWIKRKVDEDTAKRIRDLDLPGIGLTPETRRFYPKGNLACHVLGIVGIDNQGLEGIELVYDKALRGNPGKIVVEFDATGRKIPAATHRYIAPEDGCNLMLTVDEVIQFMVERELDKLMSTYSAKGACAVVMDPKTGEILALAARPGYDPNEYAKFPDEYRRNPVINDAFSPGSTFKPITAAAVLEEGLVTKVSRFYCGGSVKVPGATISCWSSGHGSQTFVDAVKNSCNVAFVNMGLRLGPDLFYKYVKAFGLTQVTGIDLPGEAMGIMLEPGNIKPVDLAVMSFGQTLTVTPIQLLSAISAIANDGVLMKPHLVKEIRGLDGTLIKEVKPEAVRRVISQETAKDLALAMEEVVKAGTGKQAYVPGYRIAGKTGTAQKSVGGKVVRDKHISSFVGFGPVDDPKVAMLIMVDEPQGAYYGGQVAAPAFGSIMKDVLSYMEVPPSSEEGREGDRLRGVGVPGAGMLGSTGAPQTKGPEEKGPEDTVEVPSVLNLTVEEAKRVAETAGLGLDVGDQSSGERIDPKSVIMEQIPPPGALVSKGTVIIGFRTLAGSAEAVGKVSVPDIRGKTIRAVADILGEIGLRLDVKGSGVARRQNPSPGTLVPRGTVIEVIFEEPGAEKPKTETPARE